MAETRDKQSYFCWLEQVWVNKGQKWDSAKLGDYETISQTISNFFLWMHPKFHVHRTLKSSSFLITEIIAQ